MKNIKVKIASLLCFIFVALAPMQISSQNVEDLYWLRMEYGPDYLKNIILEHKGKTAFTIPNEAINL